MGASDRPPPPPGARKIGENKVRLPTLNETARFGDFAREAKICGTCRHFHLEEGQYRLYGAPNKAAEIVHDYGWKERHLGADPKQMGMCGMSSEMATGATHLACDQWKSK